MPEALFNEFHHITNHWAMVMSSNKRWRGNECFVEWLILEVIVRKEHNINGSFKENLVAVVMTRNVVNSLQILITFKFVIITDQRLYFSRTQHCSSPHWLRRTFTTGPASSYTDTTGNIPPKEKTAHLRFISERKRIASVGIKGPQRKR